jgi:magnesium chelatase family protein
LTSVITSIGLKGLEGYLVQVEVYAVQGMESITIVGLPDTSVKESKRRVAAALDSTGYPITGQKIMINLSPSELRKMGPLYDLPMAIGILTTLEIIPNNIAEKSAFLGALSLDGAIQPASGMLPSILAAKKLGIKRLYIPYDENLPFLDFEKIEIVYVSSLSEVILHLSGNPVDSSYSFKDKNKTTAPVPHVDFQQIIGHVPAKKALEVAAAGEHHLLMTGPPGCGKSLLAESFPSILPPLSREAQLEIISIYQLSGASLDDYEFPPFRSPHHSASGVSIIGGGQNPKPGEISLAHRGVLFLDEMAEFTRKTLEMLRQPLEKGDVTICRARSTISYPAEFVLIGAMNPCPCGYFGSNTHYCACSKKEIDAYQNRLSGPIRDRFDLFLKMRSVDLRCVSPSDDFFATSEQVRKRVTEARQRQYYRYGKEITNNRISYEILIKDEPLTHYQTQKLQELSSKHNMSNRAQIKIIRLARTIADLGQSNKITDQNITDAIKLRFGGTVPR